MKKTFFVLAFFMCAAVTALAQDTIDGRGPLENYFRGDFPDIKQDEGYSFFETTISQERWNDVAFPMDAGSDTLTIYGIAAGMMTTPEYYSCPGIPYPGAILTMYYNNILDTSYTNVIEYMRLYDVDTLGAIIQIGEDMPVHIKTTPVSYYLNTGLSDPNGVPWPMIPMYEGYLGTPQMVTGQFFVGRTSQCAWPAGDKPHATHPVNFIEASSPYSVNNHYYEHLYVGETTNNYTTGHWYNHSSNGSVYYIFPILTPETNITGDTIVCGSDTVAMGDTLVVTDTLVIGGDTIVTCDTLLAVVQADMLARLTGVMPNPAASTAKVVSSFGLTRIEVYSSTGAKVYDRPAVGLAATLDVSRWPSGTYMVRIHTPMGVATKRLAVAR